MNTLNVKNSESKPEARRESPRLERPYADVPGLRHETKDVLMQLQSNIQYLEDLTGRMGFTLTEVRGLIRR